MRSARSTSPRRRNRLQREVQVHRLRIDLDHLDEGVDCLVLLLVEQELQALEIGARQCARFIDELLDVHACGQPAHAEKQGEGEQHPGFEFHDSLLSKKSAYPGNPGVAWESRQIGHSTITQQTKNWRRYLATGRQFSGFM